MTCLDFCDDIFDVEDDPQDANDDLETIHEQYNHNFDFERFHTNIDDEEMDDNHLYRWEDSSINNDPLRNNEEEEASSHVLLQKLSQLSTEDKTQDSYNGTVHGKKRPCSSHSSTPSTPTKILKKTRTNENMTQALIDEPTIPEYLQIQQKVFQDHIISLISKWNLTLTIEEIQSIAILKHRIASTTLDHQLWSAYLAVGMGEWPLQADQTAGMVDHRFWSEAVKVKQRSQESYEAIARQQLADCVLSIEQYEQELQGLIEATTNLSDEIEKAIDQYVETYGIRPLKIRVDYLIKKLEYDRDIEIDQREGQRRQPTDNQNTTLEHLYQLILDQVKGKQVINEIQQRILCDRPIEKTYQSALFDAFDSLAEIHLNQQERYRSLNRYEQSIQQTKTDRMLMMLLEKEKQIQQCIETFSHAMKQANMNDAFDKECSIGHFLDLISHRFHLYQNKMRCLDQYRFTYNFRNRYDVSLNQLHQERYRQFSPSMIIDTSSHSLTDEQLKLLHRGPSYVPPCQIFVRPTPMKSMNDERLTNMFTSFKHQLMLLFSKYQINMAQSMFLQQTMFDIFHRTFSVFIPSALYERAVYEAQMIDSIRKHLKEHQLILRRTADQRNIFYLGNQNDFYRLAQQFILTTDQFEYCETINHTNEFMQNVTRTIDQELRHLFSTNKLHFNLIQKLSPDLNQIILPYLYFLPDVSQIKMQLIPIVVTYRSVTSKMASYLDGLLQPIVQRSMYSTSFIHGADFMRKLYQYSYIERRLRPQTLFVTIKILHFNALTTHSNMLNTLENFLRDTLINPTIDTMPIKKFIDLMGLFLKNNYFYYDSIIYRFVRGGPQQMPIIKTLSNMFIGTWQKILIEELSLQNEFFGRCQDRIFFTWTQSAEQFEQAIERVRKRVNHIKFDVKIDYQIDFLQANIENQKGVLYTCVYHDPLMQKYTLPYVNRHAQVEHSHWLRSSLIQAVRYCTSIEDFNQQRAYLQLTLLANGYGLEFIEKRIAHFYHHFDIVSLRHTMNQSMYDRLRHQMFNFLSEQNRKLNEEQEAEQRKQLVQLIYPYQYGPRREFERQCRQLLSQQFASRLKIPSTKMNIIFQTKQTYSLNALLSQQKPFHTIFEKNAMLK